MGMQTLMPTGETLTEFFKDEESMEKRRKVLEDLGGEVQRVVRVHTNPKYSVPHQGKQEAERRVRQAVRQALKSA